jgi:type I site-specific restriction endonuclease
MNASGVYQEIAINRVVQTVLQGRRRILLCMATGTGKTLVAFQICWKLWNARWNREGNHRKPRILFLADRNVLVDDPKDKTFTPFGEARFKIEGGVVRKSRQMYFAIYPDEGDIGRGHLSNFQEPERSTPILTTPQMLTTGVDAPTCKNVVLVRVVNAMPEFKQIIGRGTRMREDYEKTWFNITDYTGSATARFANPDFDGYPEEVDVTEIDDQGNETSVREEPGEYEPNGEAEENEGPEPDTDAGDQEQEDNVADFSAAHWRCAKR